MYRNNQNTPKARTAQTTERQKRIPLIHKYMLKERRSTETHVQIQKIIRTTDRQTERPTDMSNNLQEKRPTERTT